jgi:hypothetical protein
MTLKDSGFWRVHGASRYFQPATRESRGFFFASRFLILLERGVMAASLRPGRTRDRRSVRYGCIGSPFNGAGGSSSQRNQLIYALLLNNNKNPASTISLDRCGRWRRIVRWRDARPRMREATMRLGRENRCVRSIRKSVNFQKIIICRFISAGQRGGQLRQTDFSKNRQL